MSLSLNSTYNPSCLEVITGTMYSGKSKKLIERGIRARKYGGVDVKYFKPKLDTRDENVASRNGENINTVQVKTGKEILEYLKQNNLNTNQKCLIIIDEVQFFDESLVYAVQLMRLQGYNIVVSGLDKDFRGQPFGIMPKLMALSDIAIDTLFPVCSIEGCVEDGVLPQRLKNEIPDSALSATVIIDLSKDEIEYRPVCRSHHIVPNLEEYLEKRI